MTPAQLEIISAWKFHLDPESCVLSIALKEDGDFNYLDNRDVITLLPYRNLNGQYFTLKVITMLVLQGYDNDRSENFYTLTKFIGLSKEEVVAFLTDKVKSLYLEAIANPTESDWYYKKEDKLIPRFIIPES
jgi:hypothetical protein